jgi:SHS2 domain-containing protein
MRPFDEIEHTADRAFRARGRNLRELFEHAAQAMFALEAGCEGQPVVGPVRDVAVAGFDRETLLINWLNELLYLHEVHKENYVQFEVLEISDARLRARMRVCGRGEGRRLIKAVTFHNLKLQQTEKGWEATIVVDV